MSLPERIVPFSAEPEKGAGPGKLQIPAEAADGPAWLREKLLEGLESGEPVEMTEERWAGMRDEALARTVRLRDVS